MNWGHAVLWGFGATLLLTTIMSGSRSLGFSRIDIAFLLGTLFTPDRDKAKWIGFLFHFINGWVFAFVYIAAMISSGLTHWWFGMAIGLVHALFVLVVGMAILPSFHPRMANEQHGPEPIALLEPPGFLALNYGGQTPLITILAHLIYGAVLGGFYR